MEHKLNKHEKINYIELPAKNIKANKDFFTKVFDWKFTDFGNEYSSFSDGIIDGGFYKSEQSSSTLNGAALIVFYSSNLEQTKEKIEKSDGKIVKDIFDFPGGKRFQFNDPNGNEFGVWSDK
jgi:predicted enzyme related to lactoylglutathione lyase